MINVTAILISLVFTLLIFAIIWYKNTKADKKDKVDNVTVGMLLLGCAMITYFLANMITSNDDNKIMLNNMKTGEPPF